MSRMRESGNFIICLLISLAFNLEWAVPGVLALLVHFWLGFPPLWVAWALLGIWFLVILIQLLALRAVNRAADTRPKPVNKNPYSNKDYVPGKTTLPVSRNNGTKQINENDK